MRMIITKKITIVVITIVIRTIVIVNVTISYHYKMAHGNPAFHP